MADNVDKLISNKELEFKMVYSSQTVYLTFFLYKNICKFLKFKFTYKELCHPTPRAEPHRQHSQRLDIKYSKKKVDDRNSFNCIISSNATEPP